MVDLREKIVGCLRAWTEDTIEDIDAHGEVCCAESAEDIADRIRALLPKMPELRWDGNDLFLGDLHVGHVLVDPSLGKTWVGFLTHDASPETSVCCWTDEASARSAVEAAVRKALGWEA